MRQAIDRMIGPFLRDDPKRSLWIFGIGALLGLMIAGYGLFTASGTAIALVPAEAVATVNQRPILLSDYIAQLQSQFGVGFKEATSGQKRQVLRDMVNEELMVQRGEELALPATDGDVRAALVSGVALQVSANVMAARPSEAQLRAYYQSHRERYRTNGTIIADELLLPAVDGARKARASLQTGATAAQAAALGGGRVTGRLTSETFDLTARLQLGDRLYAAIETLASGATSQSLQLPDGWHIIRMGRRLKPILPPFEGAIKTVYDDYLRDARAPVEAANNAFLRSRAEIRLADGFSE